MKILFFQLNLAVIERLWLKFYLFWTSMSDNLPKLDKDSLILPSLWPNSNQSLRRDITLNNQTKFITTFTFEFFLIFLLYFYTFPRKAP